MELLESFVAGNAEAFESVFRQFQGPVFGWILRIVRDRAAAEDLTVETFWRIYRARGQFHPDRAFGAWARRIATRLAISHLRAAPPETALDRDVPAPFRPPDPARAETLAAVRAAFARLPERLGPAAALALIEERPYAEIAETLGIAPGTVKSRVFRAVRILRKDLKRMGIEP
jgi:RNA polymerase sigma factor (sigma-70 family)